MFYYRRISRVPSVQPITTVKDLNGVEFNPGEMIIDDVVGYVGYVRSLCTDLGTPNDTKEGYKDFLDFQAEINNAHISTFEPDAVDTTNYSFDTIDLTGSNDHIRSYPAMTYNAVVNGKLYYNYPNFITPFDLPKKGDLKPRRYITPFDLDGMWENLVEIENNTDPDLT
jgi:hypothetical protein